MVYCKFRTSYVNDVDVLCFSEAYSACLELVLMKLSVQFPELGTTLMRKLLVCPADKDGSRGPIVNVATMELIYQLGKKQDSSFEDRCSKEITYYEPNS